MQARLDFSRSCRWQSSVMLLCLRAATGALLVLLPGGIESGGSVSQEPVAPPAEQQPTPRRSVA